MFRRYFKRFIYLAILIAVFLFLFFRPKNLKAVALLDAASRPASWLQAPVLELRKLIYFRESYDEYRRLRKQNELLIAKLTQAQEIMAQADRSEAVEAFRRAQNYPTLKAQVIGRDPSNWNASIIINRGQSDNIKPGMAVVSSLGVVGKVLEVGRSTSKVVLLSDPSFALASLVLRTRESGLLTGTLQGVCRLQYLTDHADVKVGDKVITSKLSSAFPEGILIGTVLEVQASLNTHTVECLVDPAVDLSQIEEVMVIKR